MKTFIPLITASIISVALTGNVYATEVQEKQKELVEQQQEVAKTQQELNQETLKASDEKAHAANESMQQVSRTSKIIGTKVPNVKGDSLGNIKELVIDPDGGHVVYAVVSFGGLFGLGDKLFALPWNALHWNRDKSNYVLNIDQEILKKAPGFDKKHWPDSSDKWDQWRKEIEQFYQAEH